MGEMLLLLFKRDWEPAVEILISVVVSERKSAQEFLQALKEAVTEWVDSSEEARAFYEQETSEDLNIGDVCSYNILPYLSWTHAPWVLSVEATQLDADLIVPYDTHLYQDR